MDFDNDYVPLDLDERDYGICEDCGEAMEKINGWWCPNCNPEGPY